jgi:hypothetical protein
MVLESLVIEPQLSLRDPVRMANLRIARAGKRPTKALAAPRTAAPGAAAGSMNAMRSDQPTATTATAHQRYQKPITNPTKMAVGITPPASQVRTKPTRGRRAQNGTQALIGGAQRQLW